MYIKDRFHQLRLAEFDQPCGTENESRNRSIKKAKATHGMLSLIIQKKYGYFNCELVEQSQRTHSTSSLLE